MKTLFTTFFIFFNTALFAGQAGSLFYSKGDVKIISQNNSKSSQGEKGSALHIGDIVKVGSKSLAILHLKGIKGGSKLKINADSEIKVEKIQGVKQSKKTSIFLKAGSAFVKVLKEDTKSGEKFVLTTPTTAMGVRGTEFFASYGKSSDKSDIWMCVNEGLVAVKAQDKKEVSVKAGEGVRVEKGEKVSNPKPLAWTRKLNWGLDPEKGDLVNKVSIEEAYYDVLDQDYD